jgi:hypothetical protein
MSVCDMPTSPTCSMPPPTPPWSAADESAASEPPTGSIAAVTCSMAGGRAGILGCCLLSSLDRCKRYSSDTALSRRRRSVPPLASLSMAGCHLGFSVAVCYQSLRLHLLESDPRERDDLISSVSILLSSVLVELSPVLYHFVFITCDPVKPFNIL